MSTLINRPQYAASVLGMSFLLGGASVLNEPKSLRTPLNPPLADNTRELFPMWSFIRGVKTIGQGALIGAGVGVAQSALSRTLDGKAGNADWLFYMAGFASFCTGAVLAQQYHDRKSLV